MMSKLIRRSLSTSSQMMVMKAKVPVFSTTGDFSRMVTQPNSLKKANLVLFGSPNRTDAGDQGLDSSIEEWKAGAFAGVGLVTKALAERDWDLLGSGLVTSDCLHRFTEIFYQSESYNMTKHPLG